MDAKQKARMEILKKKAEIKKQECELKNNLFYQECLAALQEYSIVSDIEESKHITGIVSSGKVEMHSHDDEVKLIGQEYYYIVWDNMSVPIVESSGDRINRCWDDVMAVSFDTYFVAKSDGKVIGIRH